jgi:hypothetical protein
MDTAATHHRIKIEHKDDAAIPPQPMPDLNIGDTVQYFSPAGAVKIQFRENGSPYQESEVADGQTVTVTNKGSFRARCFITLKDTGAIVGWKSDPSPSGADHDVPKKRP